MVTTISHLPPEIIQCFSPFLLHPWLNRLVSISLTKDKAKKKIRPQDTGRQKEFDTLILELENLYEQYKAQTPDFASKTETEAQRRYSDIKKNKKLRSYRK
jgi:hypothetical protein